MGFHMSTHVISHKHTWDFSTKRMTLVFVDRKIMADIFSDDILNIEDIKVGFNISDMMYFDLLEGNNRSSENRSLAGDQIKYEKALFNYYLHGIAGTTVCFVGILCNILSVIVLTRKVMTSSTYSYLSALAVCDSFVLFITLNIYLLSEDMTYPRKGAITWVKSSYAHLFPYLHPVAVTFQVTSIWLTLAFTIDRYIMICHPFRGERMCHVSSARKMIVLVYILGAVFNIPRFLEYTSEKIVVPSLKGGTETHVIVKYTDIGQNKLFIDLIHSYFYLIFVCVSPFLILAILNIFLIQAVHLSQKNGRLINAVENKRNETTVMLIGVVVIFLVCQVPALISRMVYAIDFDLATTSVMYHKINEVGNFLICVNSAINIVPYYFFGKRFRREFWTLFCRCFFTKQELHNIKQTLSFSMDNKHKGSQNSIISHFEMIGFTVTNEGCKCDTDRGNSPSFQNFDNIHRGSVLTTDTFDSDQHSSTSETTRKENRSLLLQVGHTPLPVRVVLEVVDNKRQKYNVSLDFHS